MEINQENKLQSPNEGTEQEKMTQLANQISNLSSNKKIQLGKLLNLNNLIQAEDTDLQSLSNKYNKLYKSPDNSSCATSGEVMSVKNKVDSVQLELIELVQHLKKYVRAYTDVTKQEQMEKLTEYVETITGQQKVVDNISKMTQEAKEKEAKESEKQEEGTGIFGTIASGATGLIGNVTQGANALLNNAGNAVVTAVNNVIPGAKTSDKEENATPTNTAANATPTNTVENATPTNTAANATPTNTATNATPTNTAANATPTNTAANATPTNTVENATEQLQNSKTGNEMLNKLSEQVSILNEKLEEQNQQNQQNQQQGGSKKKYKSRKYKRRKRSKSNRKNRKNKKSLKKRLRKKQDKMKVPKKNISNNNKDKK
jgi:hypothetical protein